MGFSMRTRALFLALQTPALLWAVAGAGLFGVDSESVLAVTKAGFASSVLEPLQAAAVLFYSETDCEPCAQVAPSFATAATALAKYGVASAAVDVVAEPKLVREIGLTPSVGFPFIRVYYGRSTANPYGGMPVREHKDVPVGGGNDARSLQRSVLSALPDRVRLVELSALEEALSWAGDGAAAATSYVAVFVTEKSKPSPLLRTLAHELEGGVDVFQVAVRVGEEGEERGERGAALARALGVEEKEVPSSLVRPALWLVERKGGSKKKGKASAFQGDSADREALLAFVRLGAGLDVEGEGATRGGSGGGAGGGDSKGTNDTGGVIRLTPEKLEDLLGSSPDALVVAFVGSAVEEEAVEEAVPGWAKKTEPLQGQVRAAVADCGEHPSLCPAAVQPTPSIGVYPHALGGRGDDRAGSPPLRFAPEELDAAVASAVDSLPPAVSVLPPGMSTEEASMGFQQFIAMSVESQAASAFLVVMSKREEPSLLVRTVAAEFAETGSGVRVIFVPKPSQEFMAQLNVHKLPAVQLLLMGDQFQRPEGMAEDEVGLSAETYRPSHFGPLGHRNVVTFCLMGLLRTDREAFNRGARSLRRAAAAYGDRLSPLGQAVLTEASADGDGADDSDGDEVSPGAHTSSEETEATAEVLEARSAEDWEASACPGARAGGLCALFVVDGLDPGHERALESAQKAAAKAHSGPGGSAFSFSWVDGPCQPELLAAFGLGEGAGSGLPALVVYSRRRGRYARFVGAWEESSLASFMGRVLGGRAATETAYYEPRMVADPECSERAAVGTAGAGGGGSADGADEAGADDDMDDMMAEIKAEEERARKEREAEVERELNEIRKAEAEAAAQDKKKGKRRRVVKEVKKKEKKDKPAASGPRADL